MLHLAGLSGCPVEVVEESVVLTGLGGVGCLLRSCYHDIRNAPSATCHRPHFRRHTRPPSAHQIIGLIKWRWMGKQLLHPSPVKLNLVQRLANIGNNIVNVFNTN